MDNTEGLSVTLIVGPPLHVYRFGYSRLYELSVVDREFLLYSGVERVPFKSLGFECAQHMRAPRPLVERIRTKNLAEGLYRPYIHQTLQG